MTMIDPAALLMNDSDPDGDDFDIVSVSNAASGAMVTIGGDPSMITYDPTDVPALRELAAGETLIDTFTYTIEDSAGNQATATVTITLVGVNDDPLAMDDSGGQELATDEDTTLDIDAATLLANDDDVDNGDTFSVVSVQATSALGATVTLDGTTITYDPTAADDIQLLADGASNSDTFTYTIEDAGGAMSTATVTIALSGLNDAPVAMDDSGDGFDTDEDTTLDIDVAALLANDDDVDDGDTPSFVSVDTTSALGATITVDGSTITYDPTAADDIQSLADPPPIPTHSRTPSKTPAAS